MFQQQNDDDGSSSAADDDSNIALPAISSSRGQRLTSSSSRKSSTSSNNDLAAAVAAAAGLGSGSETAAADGSALDVDDASSGQEGGGGGTTRSRAPYDGAAESSSSPAAKSAGMASGGGGAGGASSGGRAGVRRRDNLARPPVRSLRGAAAAAAGAAAPSSSSRVGASRSGAGSVRGPSNSESMPTFSRQGGAISAATGSATHSNLGTPTWAALADRVERRRSSSEPQQVGTSSSGSARRRRSSIGSSDGAAVEVYSARDRRGGDGAGGDSVADSVAGDDNIDTDEDDDDKNAYRTTRTYPRTHTPSTTTSATASTATTTTRGDLARPPVAMLRTTRGVGVGGRRKRRGSSAESRELNANALEAAAAAAAAEIFAKENADVDVEEDVNDMNTSGGRGGGGRGGGERGGGSGRGHDGFRYGQSARRSASEGGGGGGGGVVDLSSSSSPGRQSLSAASAGSAGPSRRSSAASGGGGERHQRRRSSIKFDIDVVEDAKAQAAAAEDDDDVAAAGRDNNNDDEEASLGEVQQLAGGERRQVKRGSFAQEALSSLVSVFQSGKESLDQELAEGGYCVGEHDSDENVNDHSDDVDGLVLTDDEDDDGPMRRSSHDAVPAPIPLNGGPVGAARSTRSTGMLGTGQKKFLPGASVRRHASAGDDGAAGGHSLGAYGAGAAEAAESAARAAAEFATDRRDGIISSRRKSSGVVSSDDEDEEALSSGMQVDFPVKRRESWAGNKSRQSDIPSKQIRRCNSGVLSGADSCDSSAYDMTFPSSAPQTPGVTFGTPPAGMSSVEPNADDIDGDTSDNGPEFDDEAQSDAVSSSSSSSSESMSIASEDICDDTDPFALVGYVPCSFVNARDGSDMQFIVNEPIINLDYTSSASTSGKAVGSINPAYLDAEMAAGVRGGKLSSAIAAKFASEHHVFLRAVLQLMAERDRVGVEANLDDPHTIKSGSLKKSSANLPGVWKVKFVEIRRGIFSYYEDQASSAGGESLMRRNIPLRTSLCTCRAVKLRHPTFPDVGPKTSLFGGGAKGGSGGFIFELSVQGGRKRLWMASSNEERQAWIRAIHEAMIGVSSTSTRSQASSRRGSMNSASRHPFLPWILPPKDDVDRYLQIQAATKAARSESAYTSALSRIWGTSLRIPVQRIREQAETVASFDGPNAHHDTRTRLELFFDDLSRNSLSLNGHVLRGDAKYGPDRIVGALTRCILEYDRVASEKESAPDRQGTSNFRRTSSETTELMTEVQAIGYARDVLLGCNRSGTGKDDDSFYSVETLCGNNDFVVLIPMSSQVKPVQVDVSNVNEIESTGQKNENRGINACERTGWVECSGKSNKKWKRRFCVLSEGVISYYEHGHPRPHGLREQYVLVGAALNTTGCDDDAEDEDDERFGNNSRHSNSPTRSVRKYMIIIRTRDNAKAKHYVAFDNPIEMMTWAETIRSSIESCSPDGAPAATVSDTASNDADADGEGKKGVEGLFRGFKPPFIGGGGGGGGGGTGPESGSRPSSPVQQQESKGILGAFLKKSDLQSETVAMSSEGTATPKRTFFKNIRRTGVGMAALQADKYPDATVQITVQASTMYKLCTNNPKGDKGDENQDTWGVVRTKLLRNYLLAGGPNGRMIRGEDIIEIEFLKGMVREETFHLIFGNKDPGVDQTVNIGETSVIKR